MQSSLPKFKSITDADLPGVLWEVGNQFYSLSLKERKETCEFVFSRLKEPYSHSVSAFQQLLFINQTAPYLDRAFVDRYVEYFGRILGTENEKLRNFALDSVARLNYLASPNALSTFIEHVRSLPYLQATESNREHVEKCFESLAHYVDDLPDHRIPLPSTEQPDVVFFIPEFLTGKHYLQPPVCALTAMALFQQWGISSELIDNRIYHMPMEQISSYMRERGPKAVLAITTTYDQASIYYCDYRYRYLEHSIRFLSTSRDWVTIVCGAHGTIAPQVVMEKMQPNIVLRGEWEMTALQVVQNLQEAPAICDSLQDICNIVYQTDAGPNYTRLNLKGLSPSVTDLPAPNYASINLNHYYGDEAEGCVPVHKPRWGIILAQRGCPYNCSFCYLFFGQRIRSRSPRQVVDEMKTLSDKGSTHIFMVDYTFALKRDWVFELCELIQQAGLTIPWNCETRADHIDAELLQVMKLANCHRIWLGVESFDDKMLEKSNKRTNRELVYAAIDTIMKAGIQLSTFLLLGLPGETRKSADELVEIFCSSNTPYQKSMMVVTPRAGTPLYDSWEQAQDLASFEQLHALRGTIENELTPQDLAELTFALAGI